MHFSLRAKVTFLILLLTTLIISSIGVLVIRRQSVAQQEILHKSGQRESKALAFQASRAILDKDDLSISDNLQGMVGVSGYVAGGVSLTNGKQTLVRQISPEYQSSAQNLEPIFAQADIAFWEYLEKVKGKEDAIREQIIQAPGPLKGKLVIFQKAIYHPFISPNPPLLGITQIVFSDTYIREQIRANTIDLTISAAAFWVLGILGAFLLSHYIVKPVNILSKSAEIIGSGNLEHTVPPLGTDELGQLAKRFNEMTEGLRQAQSAREEQLVLNEQIKQAKEIQEGMNPAKFLKREGFQIKGFTRAAKGVGGDYYDFLELADGKLAVLISDVSGKSISASLVMVLIKTVVSTYLKLLGAVRGDKILDAVNRIMCGEAHIDKFATILFYLYDPQTRILDFSNGGHGPIFVFRAKTSDCTTSKLEGLPMGIDDDNEYRIARMQLNPGDIVVLYTDGITECWNSSKEEFGLARLREKILAYSGFTAKEIVDKLVLDLDQFAGNAEQHDDMTLVIMKV